VLALTIAACGAPPKLVRTYPGAPRPSEQVAVVRAARHGIVGLGKLNIAAIRVDGTPVPTGRWIWQAPPDIQLEPGTHTLTLALDEGGDIQSLTLQQATFRAEAGHIYELRGERVPGSSRFVLFLGTRFAWRWSIVDTTAQTIVADSTLLTQENP
jgi:hypothetical protein